MTATSLETKLETKLETTLGKKTSKWACPACKQNRIITTHQADQVEPKRFMLSKTPSLESALNIKERMFHHCLDCGHEFSENESEKALRENKARDEGDQPWAAGSVFLILMLAAIFVIQFTTEETRLQPSSQRPERTALSTQR